ncbi:MAG: MurR/RpiR family transcriptional regulator [Clostridia bacterium]|nr:MurR/RpiR family transcriptional regulator [Clostridia bacterium]
MSNTLELIKSKTADMSKQQKNLASFIEKHYEAVAYMKLQELSQSAGVSEATILRFISELGFEGYHDFKNTLEEELKTKLTSLQRLNSTERYRDDAQAIHNIIGTDIDNLKDTVNNLDEAEFAHAIDAVLSARKIYLMGLRSSAPLSSFMHFYMSRLFDEVVNISSNSTIEVFEQILPITSNDVMIGISFPRYSQRTINSIEYAKKKGAKVIVITDKDNTQLTANADIKLFAKYSMASFVDSLTAPLSLINAFLVTLGMHRKDHIKDNFEALEELWSLYRVYENEDNGHDEKEEEIQ